MAFASNGDLILGNLEDGPVTQYHSNASTTVLVAGGQGYDPASILPEANGNLLIADLTLSNEDPGHHQVLLYNATTQQTTQFINLTQPTSGGLLPQPESLAYDQDGNLLVGVSADKTINDGAVEKFNINTGAPLGTIWSGIGTPTGIAPAPPVQSDILASTYDSNGVLRLQRRDPRSSAGGRPIRASSRALR